MWVLVLSKLLQELQVTAWSYQWCQGLAQQC